MAKTLHDLLQENIPAQCQLLVIEMARKGGTRSFKELADSIASMNLNDVEAAVRMLVRGQYGFVPSRENFCLNHGSAWADCLPRLGHDVLDAQRELMQVLTQFGLGDMDPDRLKALLEADERARVLAIENDELKAKIAAMKELQAPKFTPGVEDGAPSDEDLPTPKEETAEPEPEPEEAKGEGGAMNALAAALKGKKGGKK